MKKIFGFNWGNVLLCALCILPFICGTASGAGFALMEQSVSGLGYRLSERFSFDVAYTYIFVDDAKIAKDITDPENAVRGGLTGTYDADVNIVSAQIVWSF